MMSDQSKVELNEDVHRAVPQGRCEQPLIHEQYEFEVVWASTRLGLRLKIPQNSGHQPAKKGKTTQRRFPIVQKILKTSTLGLPSDAVGHLFVSINNWHTSGLDVEELRILLRAASKPALLRFRRQDGLSNCRRTFLTSSSYDPDERSMDRKAPLGLAYSILWTEGKLGIVFGCYEDADRDKTLVVYVKSIGPGQAQNSKFVAVGDILCSINGRDLPPKHNFKKTMHSLVNTSQPVTLGFRRLLVDRSSNWNELS